MGLYINQNKQGNIYKTQDKINEPNQSYFKREYFADLVNGQLKVNQSLQNSIYGLKSLYDKQENVQMNKWKEIIHRLNELKVTNVRHDHEQKYLVEQLKNLESDHKKLQVTLENDRLSDQEILDNIDMLTKSNQEIVRQLDVYCKENQAYQSKADNQIELQKQMSDKISMQDEVQKEVLSRIENQEAMMEKITRQIDYFRSIIFERTNYLAEKIEKGYHNTSSYVTKLISSEKKEEERVSK